MARDHARILCRIWADEDFRARSSDAQWLYFLLLSHGGINNAGVLPLQLRQWANRCATATEDAVAAAVAELVAHRFVVVDHSTEELLVRTFIRNDGVARQPNLLKNAARQARQVESQTLRLELAVELARVDTTWMKDKDVGPLVVETIALLRGGPTPPAPTVNPSANPSANGSGNPSPNPSSWLEQNPSDAAVANPSPNPSANPQGMGKGLGKGVDSRYVATHLEDTCVSSEGESRPRARAETHTPVPVPAAELAKTAIRPNAFALIGRWRAGHDQPYRHRTYRELGKHADTLIRDGADPELVLNALRRWDTHSGRTNPGLLPHLYDDAVRATRPAPPPVSTGDRRFAEAELLKDNPNPAVLAAAGIPLPPQLRALQGGAA